MMHSKVRNAILAVALIAGGSAGVVGCASSASAEEMKQLSDIRMEITSLEHRKADLEKESQSLAQSIDAKNAKLAEINKKKADLNISTN